MKIELLYFEPAHTPPDEWILRAIEEAQHG
jgi:hypothetical protein